VDLFWLLPNSYLLCTQHTYYFLLRFERKNTSTMDTTQQDMHHANATQGLFSLVGLLLIARAEGINSYQTKRRAMPNASTSPPHHLHLITSYPQAPKYTASHHILRPKHPLTTLPPLLSLPLDLILLSLSLLLPTHDQDLESVDS